MLDIKLIRTGHNYVQELLNYRNDSAKYNLDSIRLLDRIVRDIEQSIVELNTERKELAKQNSNKERAIEIKTELAIKTDKLNQWKTSLHKELLELPNLPDAPIGHSDKDNVVIKYWGAVPGGNVKPHYEIKGIDSTRGVKIAGSRFTLLKNKEALLERALINFMLDTHRQRGYSEMNVPILVNEASLIGTGQLPKFKDDLYKTDEDLYLIPTGEVPLMNIYREEVVSNLPIKLCTATPCFRKEAGSYGKDTKGLIRLHQFNKVELVKIITPETSNQEHLSLLDDAEYILQLLGLPYRVVELCSGDLGFSAAKCYDIEVYMRSTGEYREISSVSNTKDFQCRRLNIKYRNSVTNKLEYAHSLNGSGLAVGRTMAALLEYYQSDTGEVNLPKVLEPYLNACKQN
jgi:seryl-tRNA synthetase